MLVVPLQDTQGTTGVHRGASICETEEEVVNRPRSSAASAAYRSGPITVANNLGAVTFTQTSTPDSLTISGDQIATTGKLAVSAYTVSGTDRDTNGDTGTWTFTLTVANVTADVTFNANSPTGSMAL